MHFSFTPTGLPDSSVQLRREVREFLARERDAGSFVPHCSGWMVFDAAFSRRCAERGMIGLTWPKRYGGQERSAIDRYVMVEEMLAAGAPVGAHWIADRQSGPQILANGKDSLKQRLLPAIVRGEAFFGIGMSEPDAGSDLAAIRSRAHRVEGGWRLNGSKVWTTNGQHVHYILGLFRTSPAVDTARHAGMTQFVIDLSSPGITRQPIEDIRGEKDFSQIVFDDVFVPDDHVIGEPGDGWNLVTAELAFERSGPERFLSVFPLLSEALGGTGVSAPSRDHRSLGRLVAHLSVLREMSISIAGQLAMGNIPNVEAALVKDLGNRLEREIPERLREIAGPRALRGAPGYSRRLAETILAAPSFTLRGGTPEILRGVIARGLGLR